MPSSLTTDAARLIGPADVARAARRASPGLAPGESVVLLLTDQNRPFHQICLPRSSSTAHGPEPRAVFAAAFLNHCSRIVIAHSQTARASGPIVPTAMDYDHAAQLILGGHLLHITVIDYVLFNEDVECSLRLHHSDHLYLYRKHMRALRTLSLTAEPCRN
jgi:DNA repair protein RadC